MLSPAAPVGPEAAETETIGFVVVFGSDATGTRGCGPAGGCSGGLSIFVDPKAAVPMNAFIGLIGVNAVSLLGVQLLPDAD